MLEKPGPKRSMCMICCNMQLQRIGEIQFSCFKEKNVGAGDDKTHDFLSSFLTEPALKCIFWSRAFHKKYFLSCVKEVYGFSKIC